MSCRAGLLTRLGLSGLRWLHLKVEKAACRVVVLEVAWVVRLAACWVLPDAPNANKNVQEMTAVVMVFTVNGLLSAWCGQFF